MVYLGRQGSPLDRGITLRDLVDSGLVEIPDGYTLAPGSNPPITIAPGIGGTAPAPDLTPPPAPTGFTATGAISHVVVQCDTPTYTVGGGHLRARLYGTTYTTGPLPTISSAVELGQFEGPLFAHPSNPSTTWRLWLRWESQAGVLSDPAGGTNGLSATTGQDVSLLLTALTGQITQSQLFSTLGSRIDLIDAASGVTGSVNARIKVVQDQVNSLSAVNEYAAGTTYTAGQLVKYLGKLYVAKSTTTGNLPTNTTFWDLVGDYDSLANVVSAHTATLNNHESRITSTESGLTAEITSRQALATQLRGSYAGTDLASVSSGLIFDERQARSSADSSQVSRISALEASVDTPTTGLKARVSTVEAATTNATSGNSALATRLTTVEVTTGNLDAAVQAETTARINTDNSILAKNTVKIDIGGHVSGYGLISTANNATPTSAFGVRADQFFIAPPSIAQATAPSSPYRGMVWVDTSVSPNVTKYWSGATWTTTPQSLPFVVLASPGTINGVPVPAGTYIDTAYIADATVTSAKIADAAIDNAKIANLNVSKLTGGTLQVGSFLQSTNYTSGASGSGWTINADGTAELQAAYIRGLLTASQIDTRGLTIRDTAGNIILAAGASLASSSLNIPGTVNNVPVNWLNTNISMVVNANGTVTATGGPTVSGSVTIAGLDSTVVRAANPINTGNVSAYIAAGAIGNAYIGNFIQSTNFDGTIDASGNITSNGTAGWAVGKAGKMVLDELVIRQAKGAAAVAMRNPLATTGVSTFDSNEPFVVLTTKGYSVSCGVNGYVTLYLNTNFGRVVDLYVAVQAVNGATVLQGAQMLDTRYVLGGKLWTATGSYSYDLPFSLTWLFGGSYTTTTATRPPGVSGTPGSPSVSANTLGAGTWTFRAFVSSSAFMPGTNTQTASIDYVRINLNGWALEHQGVVPAVSTGNPYA